MTDFREQNQSSMTISLPNYNSPSPYRLMNGPASSPASWFEIRLFYVRIAPCVVGSVPSHLTVRHLRREIGVSLVINGSRIPASETASLTLRRDRLDKESSEVTYVSTDNVRVGGPLEFEVYEREDLILCVSLERMESSWSNGSIGFDHHQQRTENDSKTGWSMDCCIAASIATGSSAFFQPKLGVSSPSIEVYVAGWSSGFPLILTKTINLSPRRKPPRHATLDAIPEDEETGKDQKSMNDIASHGKLQIADAESDGYDSEGKIGTRFYSEDMYADDDGQLSWFNAGVRVGVGIGLGMCVGIGIGVGLLMRSYQATTRTFKRRFS
ncbi:hypothetical protein NE237_012896 [Protea cynaroides]|uniref:Uncharacterized protein n=1 Tax=Protea cynaroides TaxID=273540 RepID=A0A9Q0GYB7_9MAGN|nr:hypothetical protein NE237_012896 [Protea cynaroides]